MAQYVDIMTDAGFKAVFQDKQVTIKFLNAALAGERQIKDITYLDKEIKPETVENRTIIFDLLCEDVSGAKFILEMQNCPQHYFFNRGFYYLCRMVARQGQIGKQWQYRLLPIYGVYFLNFKLPEFTDFRTDVVLANERTGGTGDLPSLTGRGERQLTQRKRTCDLRGKPKELSGLVCDHRLRTNGRD